MPDGWPRAAASPIPDIGSNQRDARIRASVGKRQERKSAANNNSKVVIDGTPGSFEAQEMERANLEATALD